MVSPAMKWRQIKNGAGWPDGPELRRTGTPRPQYRQLPAARLLSLLQSQNWICGICGMQIESAWDANVDHIVPRSKGGSGSRTNLQAAHIICNSAKGNHHP